MHENQHSGFQTRSDTNQAVQSQKQARSLNVWILEEGSCSICAAITKALISFTVTAKLICAFVFANANCWFSHAVALMFSPQEVQNIKPLNYEADSNLSSATHKPVRDKTNDLGSDQV